MRKFIVHIIKDKRANSMVENVIVLPLIFIVIYFIIVACFIIHDRSTIEAAAKRGTIYASHAICDPKYLSILDESANESGHLDTKTEDGKFYFNEVATNVNPYRYIIPNYSSLITDVEAEIQSVIDRTRIPWRALEIGDIVVTPVNKIYYQDVSVSIDANYPLPKFFEAFGLPTEIEYTVYSKTTVNDPDEFIRNVDMAVDLIVDIDDMTGGHLSGAVDKVKETLSGVGEKIKKFMDME